MDRSNTPTDDLGRLDYQQAGRCGQLAIVHAPVGGTVIQGQQFRGGEFIPSELVEKEKHSQDRRSRLSRVLSYAGKVPGAVKQKATEFVQNRYRKLEDRYGRKGAIAVLGAMALLTPVPLPEPRYLHTPLAPTGW